MIKNEAGYEGLANAIILQAVEDYRKALNELRKNPCDEVASGIKRKVEIFFRSDWYGELTGIDPEMLIRKLNEKGNT